VAASIIGEATARTRSALGPAESAELAWHARRLAPVPTSIRLALALALLMVAATLAACASGTGSTPAPTPVQGLAGRTFVSISVSDGGADRPLVPGTTIRLGFQATSLTASAGCNTMGGGYRLDGDRLIVDQMSSTAMSCPDPLGAQDAWLAQLLGARPSVHLDGHDLTLAAGSIVIRLTDRGAA
jgi:heat shock protein HslJ